MSVTMTNGKTYKGVGEVDGERILPHACSALEAAILGAVTTRPGEIRKAREAGLTVDCFRGPRERAAFTGACLVDESGIEVERHLVWKSIFEMGLVPADITFPEFERYGQFIDPVFDVEFLSRRLIDERQRRETRYRLLELANRCEDDTQDLGEIFDEVERLRAAMTQVAAADALHGMLGLCDPKTPLRPPLIDGLARIGETININATSKAGKSWLIALLCLCMITGQPLFDRFAVTRGEVMLLDNELHPETLNYRIRTVAAALGIQDREYEPFLHAHALRGKLTDIYAMEPFFRSIPKGRINAICLDAKYRFDRQGGSENDNNEQTGFYNTIDRYAEMTGAGFILNHHNSKGDQSGKQITDVGSGAGAQSRAADCHIVLRPHEVEGCAVMEAVVRSFAPVQPLVLRWEFPLWVPDDNLDPAALKRPQTGRQEAQERTDKADTDRIVDVLLKAPKSSATMIGKILGMDPRRVVKLLSKPETADQIRREPATVGGRETEVFSLID